MSAMPYCAVWEFLVKPESVAEFERVYGPDGAWAELFRLSSDYLGTELLRDADHAGRYVTIDRWSSREALCEFKKQHAEEYAALDEECETLTKAEKLLGQFVPAAGFTGLLPSRLP